MSRGPGQQMVIETNEQAMSETGQGCFSAVICDFVFRRRFCRSSIVFAGELSCRGSSMESTWQGAAVARACERGASNAPGRWGIRSLTVSGGPEARPTGLGAARASWGRHHCGSTPPPRRPAGPKWEHEFSFACRNWIPAWGRCGRFGPRTGHQGRPRTRTRRSGRANPWTALGWNADGVCDNSCASPSDTGGRRSARVSPGHGLIHKDNSSPPTPS